MTNTRELDILLYRSSLRRDFVAKELGISTMALYNKVHNKSQFNAREIAKLCKLLGIKDFDTMQRIFFND